MIYIFAFCMAWLEFGFVLYGSRAISANAFQIVSGVPCILLMIASAVFSWVDYKRMK
jgi:hypothetical protein